MMFVSFILSRIVEENISSISAVELGNVKIVQQNRKPREQKGMTEYFYILRIRFTTDTVNRLFMPSFIEHLLKISWSNCSFRNWLSLPRKHYSRFRTICFYATDTHAEYYVVEQWKTESFWSDGLLSCLHYLLIFCMSIPLNNPDSTINTASIWVSNVQYFFVSLFVHNLWAIP